MLNRVTIIGNLGRDPEIRHTRSGDPIANLSVAVTEKWKDKSSGEHRENTEWVRCVLFGNLAETAQKYLVKGSKVYLEGKFATRKWQDQSGVEKYSTEVVLSGFNGKMIMLDSKPAGSSDPQEPPRDRNGDPDIPDGGDLDDEIPF